MSTLLLQKNFKLEYTAASDAYTYVPEGFFEFFNQRRRWAPSTLANIFEIIVKASSVTNANKYISKPYLVYHMFLFASSLITPGTIFLMILGATKLAFPVIPTWLAFLINLSLVCIVIVGCMLAEGKTQVNIKDYSKSERFFLIWIFIFWHSVLFFFKLRITAVISAIYSLMMVVVLFGLIIDAISSGFCSVTTYFFLYVAGIFFVAAVLHPRVMYMTSLWHHDTSNGKKQHWYWVILHAYVNVCMFWQYFLYFVIGICEYILRSFILSGCSYNFNVVACIRSR